LETRNQPTIMGKTNKIMNYKIFFIAAFVAFSTLISAQEDELNIIDVKTDIYEITYSQTYQQPLMVKYTVICDATAPSYPRHGISFTKVEGIKTSSSSDYSDNVWDKGHMAPANTFSCKKEWLETTFTYTNCALQHQNLNRGAWAALEGFERDLAAIYDDIEVDITIYFSEEWTTNSDPARIPSNFIKTLTWTEDNGKIRSIAFDFPNENTKGKSFWAFKLKDGDWDGKE
jgi:DNA/RNA endonuclease G (NUC1)